MCPLATATPGSVASGGKPFLALRFGVWVQNPVPTAVRVLQLWVACEHTPLHAYTRTTLVYTHTRPTFPAMPSMPATKGSGIQLFLQRLDLAQSGALTRVGPALSVYTTNDHDLAPAITAWRQEWIVTYHLKGTTWLLVCPGIGRYGWGGGG